MTELTVDRVRSVLTTNASAYAVADYIRLLDVVGFEEVTATDQRAMEALNIFHYSTLAKRLHQLYAFGLATRRLVIEPKRGRSAFAYKLKDGDTGQND
jgi:predicted transcriptional regulator